jgi:hypothetical protein
MPCRLGGRWTGFIGGYHLEQRHNVELMLEAYTFGSWAVTGCAGVAVLSSLVQVIVNTQLS